MVRPDRDRIGDKWSVEVEEAYVGGKTRGEGHGVHHKAIVVGAVEVRTKVEKGSRRPIYAGRLRLQVVKERSAKTLETFVAKSVEFVKKSKHSRYLS